MTPFVHADQVNGQHVVSKSRTSTTASLPNPSLQVTPDHSLKLVEAPVYTPRKGEALVHIKATGIWGSDIHFWKAGRIGPLVFEGDCIIGHEAAGVVLQCGEGVAHLKPGLYLCPAKYSVQ